MEPSRLIFQFGPFEAKTCAQELSKNGTTVRLRGQPFSILELLLSRAGEVVTREEIRQKLWPADTFVDFEHGLNTSMKKLRQALCDSATEARYIETIPRLGYRFIAPVEATVEPKAKKPTAVETVSGVVAAPDSATTVDSEGHVSPAAGTRPRLHLFLAQRLWSWLVRRWFSMWREPEIDSLLYFGRRKMRPWQLRPLPNRSARLWSFRCRTFPITQPRTILRME
jgi:DNA-binding winged helix-turn-helix (wHTH) protein